MRSYFLREEHEILRKTVRGFVEKELLPNVDKWEEEGIVPRDVFRKMGELGLLGIKYPEKYGGAGADMLATAVFVEELARCRSAGVTISILVHTDMASPHIAYFGTEEQKEEFLVPIIRGERICAIAVTEPNAGSDVAGIETTAIRDGSAYIINGSKTFITNAINADIFVVAAKTDKTKRHAGITMFIVEKGTPGFRVVRKLEKMGWRSSDTGELLFEDCRVDERMVLGEVNKGFYAIMRNFQGERLVMAIAALSASEQAVEDAIRYTQTRKVFGKTLSEYQVIRHRLAELATKIEAAKHLIYHTVKLYDDGMDCTKEVSMCKLFACELANEVAYHCLQIYGGYGYMKEYPIERFYRDMRVMTIGGGTSEIMKEIIAKKMEI